MHPAAEAAIHADDLTAEREPRRAGRRPDSAISGVSISWSTLSVATAAAALFRSRAGWNDGFDLKFFAPGTLPLASSLLKAHGSMEFIAGVSPRAPVADAMVGAPVVGARLAFTKALPISASATASKSTRSIRARSRRTASAQPPRPYHPKPGLDEAAAFERHRQALDITASARRRTSRPWCALSFHRAGAGCTGPRSTWAAARVFRCACRVTIRGRARRRGRPAIRVHGQRAALRRPSRCAAHSIGRLTADRTMSFRSAVPRTLSRCGIVSRSHDVHAGDAGMVDSSSISSLQMRMPSRSGSVASPSA